ncbi:MAG: choice-of-anchor D domain-containing protein [Planctomycetes bacterium]|nr:choice-of-anchor D domain-containing protein [Planctomycetota bacterium]
MWRLTAICILGLALADGLSGQTSPLTVAMTSTIAPAHTGSISTYHFTAGDKIIPGWIWTVPNGTTLANLGLRITVDEINGGTAVSSASQVYPAISGFQSGEWGSGTLMQTPFSIMPGSGTFQNDTTYYINLQLAATTGGIYVEDHAIVILVGDPNGQGTTTSYPAAPFGVSVSATPTIASQPIAGTIDVPVGTSVSALGLNIDAENTAWESVGLVTTITNTAGTGIIADEFCGYGHHSLNRPGSSVSGVFNSVGTHEFKMLVWGLVIDLVNQGGYLHFKHHCIATKATFTINVVPDPRIGIADSTGAVQPGASAAGDRNFGTHDMAQLPTPWATLTISNSGSGDLTLGGWNFAAPAQGSGGAAFGFDSGGYSQVVPQGGSCQLKFRLEGGSVGVNSVWIELSHDDPTVSNPFRFELRGEITIAPRIGVADSAGPIQAGASAAGPRDFGNVDVATMPTAYTTITIASTGSGPLTLGTPALVGAHATAFVLDLSAFTATVPAGGSTSFGIAFDASNIGVKSATVTFTHDDTTKPTPFTFGIAGVAFSSAIPLIVTTSLPASMQGVAYGPQQIVAVGGTGALSFSLSVGALPAGIALSPDGVLSGMPTQAGSYDFTIRVQDAVGANTSQPLTLVVAVDALSGAAGSGGTGSAGGCVAVVGANPLLAMLGLFAVVLPRRRRR